MSSLETGACATKPDVFQAIADPTRRKLLSLLSDREIPIVSITEQFPISRTAVNKHLRVLLNAGLLTRRQVGRETRYKLQPEPLLELKRWLSYYEQFWDNKLAVLKNYVEVEDTGCVEPLRLTVMRGESKPE